MLSSRPGRELKRQHGHEQEFPDLCAHIVCTQDLQTSACARTTAGSLERAWAGEGWRVWASYAEYPPRLPRPRAARATDPGEGNLAWGVGGLGAHVRASPGIWWYTQRSHKSYYG